MVSGSSVLAAFREDFTVNAANAQTSHIQTSGLTLGAQSDYFTSKPLQHPFTTATYFVIQGQVTNSSSAAVSPNSGTDLIDLILGNGGQIMVFPAPNGAFRSQLLRRKAMESVEKFVFDTNFGYPRAAPPTAAASTSTPFTISFYVPTGGPASSIRFILPSSPQNVYATPADITVSYQSITSYCVEGDNDLVWAYKESDTPMLASALQDLSNYFPTDIQPDLVMEIGESASTISSVFAVALNGTQLYNTQNVSSIETGMIALTPRTGVDPFALDLPAMGAGFLTLQEVFTTSASHDIVYLQASSASGATANPPQAAAPTVGEAVSGAPPAVEQVGVVNSAGAVVQAPPITGHAAVPTKIIGTPTLLQSRGPTVSRNMPGGLFAQRRTTRGPAVLGRAP